jgi:hypothetical protein
LKKVLCFFTVHCVCRHDLQYTVYVVTIYSTLCMSSRFTVHCVCRHDLRIDAIANEIDVVLKFFDLGMRIQALISQKQNKVAII